MAHATEAGAFSMLNATKSMCQCLKHSNISGLLKKVIYFYGFKSTVIFFTFNRLSDTESIMINPWFKPFCRI